jgi:hypothetical protein
MKTTIQQEKVSFVVMSKLSKCIANLMASSWVATSASLTTQTLASVSQFTPPKRVSDLTFTLKNEIIN